MSVVYFGAPAKSTSSVSEEIKSLGLNYLRQSPSNVVIQTAIEYAQPGYAVYKAFIPSFIKAAKENKAVSTRSSIYQPVAHTTVPAFIKNPKIIWSYTCQLSPQEIDVKKEKFGCTETKAKGRLAFAAVWKDQAWWEMLKNENNINRQTPANIDCLNMQAFSSYIIIWRMLDAVLRVNQYSAFKTNDKADVGEIKLGIRDSYISSTTPVDVDMDDGTTVISYQRFK
jgi:hypothetical protein